MPSDERVTSALQQLRAPIAAFRGAAAVAAERVRGYLAAATQQGDGAARALAELGSFAAGRIDAARFAAVFAGGQALDAATRSRLERAERVLRDVAASPDDAFAVDVPSGGDVRDAVDIALARLGRAFGAALVAELARGGALDGASHDALLDAMPFAAWNRAERRIAPPLVVSVDGADLRGAALAEFVDEGTKLVLVVRGPCAPAPLARLVSPATLVIQAADAAALARVAEWNGGAVAALVPEGAATFVHDPARGDAAWQRLTIDALPIEAPRKALRAASAWQQGEELAQLRALAAPPAAPASASSAAAAPAEAPVPDTPVDRLAAWLLDRVSPPTS